MGNQDFDYSNDILSLKDINEYCESYITSHYPVGKQLTVQRLESDIDKTVMYDFIDACREWANSENPKPKNLYEIKPT